MKKNDQNYRLKFDTLREAVESFVIADATCSREDTRAALIEVIRRAGLEKYL